MKPRERWREARHIRGCSQVTDNDEIDFGIASHSNCTARSNCIETPAGYAANSLHLGGGVFQFARTLAGREP